MSDSPTIRLELESKPETLTLIRAALSGIGELLRIDAELLDDLKMATSEAANNVIMHAYGQQPGTLSICLFAPQDEIEVVVRDRGRGIAAEIGSGETMTGVGIPIIQAVTKKATFGHAEGGGTEARMTFAGTRAGKPLFEPLDGAIPDDGWIEKVSGDAVVSLSPATGLAGVLGRIARALAATARFSLDRFSDVYLVTDAIAAHARTAAGDRRITFGIAARPRRLEMTIGPFRVGSSDPLQSSSESLGVTTPLLRLSDEVEVQRSNGSERLHVVMLDPRR